MLVKLLGLRWWALKRKFNAKYQGPFSEINSDGYFIAIVSRGEELLYEDLTGEMRFPLFLSNKRIDTRFMGADIEDARKLLVLQRVKNYFEKYQGYTVEIIEY